MSKNGATAVMVRALDRLPLRLHHNFGTVRPEAADPYRLRLVRIARRQWRLYGDVYGRSALLGNFDNAARVYWVVTDIQSRAPTLGALEARRRRRVMAATRAVRTRIERKWSAGYARWIAEREGLPWPMLAQRGGTTMVKHSTRGKGGRFVSKAEQARKDAAKKAWETRRKKAAAAVQPVSA